MSSSGPKCILVITSTLPANRGDGTPEFVLDFSEAFDVERVIIIAPMSRGASRSEEAGRVRIHRYRYSLMGREALATDAILPALRSNPALLMQIPGFLAGMLWATWRAARRERPDLIHAHWLVPGGVVARVVSRAVRVPYVVSAHGADATALDGRLGRMVKRWVMRGARRTYPVSAEIRSRLLELCSDRVGEVITMGIDLEQLSKQSRRRGSDVVFVGRLADKKGVDVLIRAAAQMTSPPTVRIVGDGPERVRLEALAASACCHTARFEGQATRESVINTLAGAGAVAIPSVVGSGGDEDGTPVVLMEAMALGAPIVGSCLGGIAECIIDGETGLLVEAGNPTELARALERLLGDAALSTRLGEAASIEAIDRFDVNTLASRLLADASYPAD